MAKIPKRLKKIEQGFSHARSAGQEKELATRFSGRVTAGSGSGNEKGDVRIKGVARIEAKTTQNKSFSVTREMIEKIEGQAMSHGELPVFVVEFNTQGKKSLEVAVVPMWALDLLINQQR